MKKGQKRDAYCALINGETITNEFDEFGDMVGNDKIAQVQYSHPCLVMEIEKDPKRGRRVSARLSDHQAYILNHPKSFYEGEVIINKVVWSHGRKTMPAKIEHKLVINGRNVERDVYYITETTTGRSMETIIADLNTQLGKIKAYGKIAGLDVYYQDGRHIQYCYDKNSRNVEYVDIAKRISQAGFVVNKAGALVYKKGPGNVVTIPDQMNIGAVRAMYFGQLVMM